MFADLLSSVDWHFSRIKLDVIGVYWERLWIRWIIGWRGLFFSQIVIRKGEEVDGLFRYSSRQWSVDGILGKKKKKKLARIDIFPKIPKILKNRIL